MTSNSPDLEGLLLELARMRDVLTADLLTTAGQLGVELNIDAHPCAGHVRAHLDGGDVREERLERTVRPSDTDTLHTWSNPQVIMRGTRLSTGPWNTADPGQAVDTTDPLNIYAAPLRVNPLPPLPRVSPQAIARGFLYLAALALLLAVIL